MESDFLLRSGGNGESPFATVFQLAEIQQPVKSAQFNRLTTQLRFSSGIGTLVPSEKYADFADYVLWRFSCPAVSPSSSPSPFCLRR